MRKNRSLRNIDALVHDFDGVLYRFTPVIHETSDIAMASAFCAIAPDAFSHPEATQMAKDGYRLYGDSVTIFTEWAKKNGIENVIGFRQQLFKDYHINLFQGIQRNAPHVLRPSPDLMREFEFSRHIRKGIATHGCTENWVMPFLAEAGLTEYFDENAILGLSDVGFARKSEDPALVNACLNALAVPANEAGFIEDSAANLELAKSHFPHLTTIFLHHGKPFETLPSHIDFQFRNLLEMKRALNRAQSPEDRKIIVSFDLSQAT